MRIFRGHTDQVRGVAYTPDGSLLASCGDDGSVRLWDLRSGGVPVALAINLGKLTAYGLAVSPDGTRLATAWSDKRVRLWSLPDRSPHSTLEAHSRPATSVAFQDDERLVSGCGAGTWTGEVALWDFANRTHRLCPIEGRGVWSVAVDPTSSLIAIGTSADSGAIYLWGRDSTPSAFRGSAGSRVRSLAFSPDGRSLAQADLGGLATVWDLEGTGERFSLVGHAARITAVAYSPDGSTLATASADGNVRLWDASTGVERDRYGWSLGRLGCVAFAPDGMTIAAGGDRDLVVWDVEP